MLWLLMTVTPVVAQEAASDPISPFMQWLIGFGGLGLLILLLLFRRLVLIQELDNEKSRSEEWKKAYETERDSRLELQESVKDLKAGAEVTAKFLEAIRSKVQ